MNSKSERAEVIVRLLGEQDALVLERVDDDVFDHRVRADLVAKYLHDDRNLLAVAIQDDMVIGMATALLYVHPDKPLQMFINEVGVAGRCHCRGIGKKLMNVLLDHGRRIGCTEAWVATEEANTAARALYTSVKGTEDAMRAVVYTWSLAPDPAPPDRPPRNRNL